MKKIELIPSALIVLFELVESVKAAGESWTDEFLGSPLIILLAIIILDVAAIVYRRIRQ